MQGDGEATATNHQQQQQQQEMSPDTDTAAEADDIVTERYLRPSPDDWQPPSSISYLIVPLRDPAAATSSSSTAAAAVQGLQDPQAIPAEAYPSLDIRVAGLEPCVRPVVDWAKVAHMGTGVVSLPDLLAGALGLPRQQTQVCALT
jgi:hypothetical protein